MSYNVSQGNIFGRLGSSIGQGIAESLPREVERGRKAQGLQQFEKEYANLTPIQQLARLSAIPGMTPQEISSFTELAKQASARQAYQNRAARGTEAERTTQEPITSPTMKALRDVQFANLPQAKTLPTAEPEQKVPSGFQTRTEEAEALPGPRTKSPLSPELMPVTSWSPQRRDDEIGRILRENPALTIPEAVQIAADNEARYKALPKELQAIEDRKEEITQKAEGEFDKQLQTILQKQGNEIYNDLTGESVLNLKKAMVNDLATNPRLTERTAAEKWIKKGKDLATAKQDLKVFANRSLFDRLLPNQKEQTLKKLLSAQKIFDETGNSEELYNILRSNNLPPQRDAQGNIIDPGSYGLGLSNGGAALIAYPRSATVKEVIRKNQNFGDLSPEQLDPATRKFAMDILNNLTGNDSLLAIAREMKQKNPYFNEALFFDVIRDNTKNLTPRMKNELLQTETGNYLPTWGDIALFPAFTKSVAHD